MRRASLASLAALVTAAVTVVAQPPARAEDLLDQYAATNRFRTGAPASVTITPDGAEVLYLRSADGRDRVMNLYAVDVRTGRERVLLTAQQILAGGEEKLNAVIDDVRLCDGFAGESDARTFSLLGCGVALSRRT